MLNTAGKIIKQPARISAPATAGSAGLTGSRVPHNLPSGSAAQAGFQAGFDIKRDKTLIMNDEIKIQSG